MSPPVRPSALAVLALAAAVAAAPACTQNHRRGMMFVGGAAAIVGVVMVGDGISCDEGTGGPGVCDDDRQMMWLGLATLAGGLALAGAGMYLQREAEKQGADE